MDIQHLDIILEARKNLVLMESNFPEELQATFNNLENASNAWGLPPDERDAWLLCMERALEEREFPPDFREYLLRELRAPAERIVKVSRDPK